MRRLLALFLLVLAPCTAAAQTAGGTPPPAAQAAAPAPSILGDYTMTISVADLPDDFPSDRHDGLVGAWRMAFHGGNHFVVHYEGEEVIQGSYQLNGDQLVFGDDETGLYVCNIAATYTWTLSGDQLILTGAGEDPCGARPFVLTTHPWTRVP
jgi:hypothetical protein